MKPIPVGQGTKCFVTRDTLDNMGQVMVDEEIQKMSFYFPKIQLEKNNRDS